MVCSSYYVTYDPHLYVPVPFLEFVHLEFVHFFAGTIYTYNAVVDYFSHLCIANGAVVFFNTSITRNPT